MNESEIKLILTKALAEFKMCSEKLDHYKTFILRTVYNKHIR